MYTATVTQLEAWATTSLERPWKISCHLLSKKIIVNWFEKMSCETCGDTNTNSRCLAQTRKARAVFSCSIAVCGKVVCTSCNLSFGNINFYRCKLHSNRFDKAPPPPSPPNNNFWRPVAEDVTAFRAKSEVIFNKLEKAMKKNALPPAKSEHFSIKLSKALGQGETNKSNLADLNDNESGELKVAQESDEETEPDEEDEWTKGCRLDNKRQEDEYNRLHAAHLSSRKATAQPKKIGELKVAQESDEETEPDEEDEWTKGFRLDNKRQEEEYNRLHFLI